MLQHFKTLALCSVCIFWSCYIFSQPNLTRVEYYVDVDPGYGNATTISITPGINLSNLTANIDPATVSNGVHIFGVRAKDNNGAWSLDNKWLFVKDAAATAVPNIIKAEYYIDTDPGYGNGTAINITPGTNLFNLTANIDPATVHTGVHIFGVRAKDANGAWSLDNKWLFVKDAAATAVPNIIKAEYYIDTDPGYGNATAISITPGTNLFNLTANIDPATVHTGVHIFGVRAKDANGAWSLDNKWLFVKDTLPAIVPNIVRVEYYIDKDPGYGNGTAVTISADTNLVDIAANVDPSLFGNSTHIFGIRAKDANGAWSLDNKLLFIGGSLPIILSKFSGTYNQDANELTAVIEQAINVKVVELQRSTDGISFSYLGNVVVAPVTRGTYIYDDNKPVYGNNFYRLRIVDFDGHANYSPIVLLNRNSKFKIQAYPNPVKDNLILHFQNVNAGVYNVQITDIQGRLMLLHKVRIAQLEQSGDVNIPFNQYLAGTYIVQVTDESNKIVTIQKIIKQ